MLKKAITALLAATMLAPAAFAQDNEGLRHHEIRSDGDGGERPHFQRPAEAQAAPAYRPERQPDQPRPAVQVDAQPRWQGRGGWGQRDAGAPRPTVQAGDQAQPRWQGRGGWGQRQPDAPRPAFQAGDQAQSRWQGRNDGGQHRWLEAQPRIDVQQPRPQGDWNRGDGDRGRDARDYRSGDWRRDPGAPVATDQRRFDAGQADAGRRYQDQRRWQDQQRRSDDQRRWNSDQRYDAPNYAWNGRNDWSRRWRDDNRYDWNRYRQLNRNIYRLPRYYAPYDWNYGYRRFSIGVTLSSLLWAQDYWIEDPAYYRLPPAYGPYRWVRYYNDALLVDIRTGFVVDAVYDIFW